MEKLTLKNNVQESQSIFWETIVIPVLKHKRSIYALLFSTMFISLIVSLFLSNHYTSTASILPTGNSGITSELKDLAAGSLGDLGLGGNLQAQENSSALYPSILASRRISERILDRDYSFYHKNKPYSLSLAEYIDSSNKDRALRKLHKLVAIDMDRKTGVIKLSVTTTYPELSAAVVHAYLEELDEYNINHRQSSAMENEKFTAQRLKEIRSELEQAEDSLRSFKESNMNYMISNDPYLQLELSRLQRDVDIKSSLYLILAQQNENAKVEAVKDIPVVQILDEGAVPLEKSSPRRSVIVLGAVCGSLLAGIMGSVWLEIIRKRQFDRQLGDVITSSGIRLNRIEAGIASRISRLTAIIEKKEKL